MQIEKIKTALLSSPDYLDIKFDRKKLLLPPLQAFLYFLIDVETRLLLSIKNNNNHKYIVLEYNSRVIENIDEKEFRIKREKPVILISHDDESYYDCKTFFIKEESTEEEEEKMMMMVREEGDDVCYYENTKFLVLFNTKKKPLDKNNATTEDIQYHLSKTDEEKLINRGNVCYEVDFHIKFAKYLENPDDDVETGEVTLVFGNGKYEYEIDCFFIKDKSEMKGEMIFTLY